MTPWLECLRKRERVFGSIAVEEFVMLFVSFVFELLFTQMTQEKTYATGEQTRQGLKPWDIASDAVENPTRFLDEMRSTQSQFPT